MRSIDCFDMESLRYLSIIEHIEYIISQEQYAALNLSINNREIHVLSILLCLSEPVHNCFSAFVKF